MPGRYVRLRMAVEVRPGDNASKAAPARCSYGGANCSKYQDATMLCPQRLPPHRIHGLWRVSSFRKNGAVSFRAVSSGSANKHLSCMGCRRVNAACSASSAVTTALTTPGCWNYSNRLLPPPRVSAFQPASRCCRPCGNRSSAWVNPSILKTASLVVSRDCSCFPVSKTCASPPDILFPVSPSFTK